MRNRGHWIRALRMMWKVSPGHMLAVLSTTVMVAVIPAISIALTTVAVDAVAEAVADGDSRLVADAVLATLLLAGAALLAHLLTVLQDYVTTLMQFRVANRAGEQIMEKAIRLQLRHYEDPETYNRLQLATREAAYRPYQIFSDLTGTLTSAVALISVSAVVLSWNWLVALVVLLAPVPSVVSSVFYGRIGWRIETDRSADRRRSAYLQHLVTTDRTFKETRLFGLGPHFLNQYRDLVNGFYRVDRGLQRRQSLVSGLLGLLSIAATAGALYLAVRNSVTSGEVGRFAGYITAIALVQTTAQGLFVRVSQLYEHNLFLGNLFGFLDLDELPPRSGPRPFPARLRKGIEFRGVSFTYPGTGTTVLDDISLLLPAGKCVAMVGRNGAGKTTLVKLLTRLYEPTSGTILIDDVPIDEYDLEDLRRNIGVIFQDFVQYEATARHNIGFGRLDAIDDDDRIRRAATDSGILPALEALPDGIESQLGRWFKDGSQLSVGQWQKLALSRAFLRGAPVVVLDEPTASIDAAAEVEIFSRLTEIAAGATALLIAHRFSTVRLADHIVVLEGGRVVEEGDHTRLMVADGLYARLFRLQAAGYVDLSAAVADRRGLGAPAAV